MGLGAGLRCAAIMAALVSASMMSMPAAAKGPWGRTIGTFCIQGIPDKGRLVTATRNIDGVDAEIFDVDYAHKKDKDPWPVVRVFKDIPQAPHALAECNELVGETVIEGYVKSLKIKGGRETVAGQPKAVIYLPQRSVELELVRAKAEMGLYGGTMRVGKTAEKSTSGRAWIKNADAMVAEAGQPTQGSIDLETWGRELIGAKVVLPGTTTTTSLDMSSGNTNVTVRLPLSGGHASFREGVFAAKNAPFEGATVVFPGVEFGTFKGVAADVSLKATRDRVDFVANKLSYSTGSSRFQAPHSRVGTGTAEGSIQTITAAAGRSGDAIKMSEPEIVDLLTEGKVCGYDIDGVPLVGAAACRVSVLNGKDTERTWQFDTAKPSSLFASKVLQSAGPVSLNSVVHNGSESFKGLMKDASVQFGAIGLQKQLLLLGNPVNTSGDLKFPFSLAAAPGTSTWSLSLPKGKLSVEGTLTTAKIKGVVTLTPADLSAYAVDVAKDDLAFNGKVSVTHEPYLYGAKPTVGALGLEFRSETDLHVTKDGGTGALYASTDVLILADPVISLGDEEGAIVLVGPQKFQGAVGLTFDLATGIGDVKDGLLQVSKAKMTTKPNKPGDLGNVRMWNGEVSVEDLQAKFHDGKGTFAINGIAIRAERLEAKRKADDAGSGNQLVWSGAVRDSSGIQSIEGEIVKDPEPKALKVQKTLITDAKFKLADIRMGQGRSLRFKGGELEVNLESWADDAAKGSLVLRNSSLFSSSPNEYGKLDVNVGIVSFGVDITGGTPAAPNGSGSLLTTAIGLQTDTKVEIKESCDGYPDFQGVPVRVNVATGPTSIKINLEGGALKGQGVAMLATASMHNTAGYECRAKVIDWMISKEQRAYYDYPCPTWSKPTRMCDGWTIIAPEVSVSFSRVIKVRSLQVSGFFAYMSLTLDGSDKVKACGKLGNAAPLADIAYFIKPNSSLGGLDQFIDAVLDYTSRPFASALLTGLTGAYGFIMPLTNDGLCS